MYYGKLMSFLASSHGVFLQYHYLLTHFPTAAAAPDPVPHCAVPILFNIGHIPECISGCTSLDACGNGPWPQSWIGNVVTDIDERHVPELDNGRAS
jgi:hypothetical protein